MIYFKNSIPSPSTIMWAVNPETEGVLKVTIDSDAGTYGGKPGIHITTERLEGLSYFMDDCTEVSQNEFDAHYIAASAIQAEYYLKRVIRTIPADL